MLKLFRGAVALCVAALLTAMLGPFQGAERQLGLTDGIAHAVAFAIITAGLLVLFPTRSRLQLAGLALIIGIAVEMAQGATGRSASVADLIADSLGILVVTLGWWRRRLV